MVTLAEKYKLSKASFRGVPFFVEQGSRTGGRRVQVHEYPQRDEPYPEDLGRATREYTITAFVVGADYIAAANKLLAECEKPGSGTLVHPWLGSVEVVLKEPAHVSYSKTLGQATIELSFVESGSLAYPAATASTAKQSGIAADNLGNAAADDCAKKLTIAKQPDFVAAAAAVDINNLFATLAQPKIPGLDRLNFANTALTSVRSVLLLVNDPTALAYKVQSLLGMATIAGQLSQRAYLLRSVIRLANHGTLAPVATPPNATPSTVQQYVNTNALNSLFRLTLLSQAVGISSVVPATVHDETVALRNTLADALDAEAAIAPDTVYQALIDARSKIWTDLTARSKNAARLTTVTPPEVMPMLAISWDYYGDATREAEIVERNNVRHPLFVPVKPLKVLAA